MADSKITKEDVKKIAKLSKLNLTDAEVKKFAGLFTDTLEYMDMLNELDTSEVKETHQVTGLTNVFQNNEEDKSLTQNDALLNADETEGGYFVTEAVFDR